MKNIIKICVSILIVLVFLVTLRSLYATAVSLAPDFSVLWFGAKDIFLSKNPYLDSQLFTGVGYPPNTLLFYLPFTFIPYQTAQLIFIVLSIFSIIIVTYLSFLNIKNPKPFWPLIGLSLILLSFPTRFTIGMGQNNALAFFLLLLSYNCYNRYKLYNDYKYEVLSGLLLGLSFSLKTIFGFFLLFFLLKKEWRIIFYSLATFFAGVLLVNFIWHSEPNLYVFYFQKVVPPLLNLSGREIYYNQGISGFVARLISNLPLRGILSFSLSLFVLMITLATAFLKKNSKDLLLSLFITTLVLIDSLSWQHHFIWLIFPFIILTVYYWRYKRYFELSIIFISYLFVSWNFKNPGEFSAFPLSLLLSNTFYGAVILYFLNLQALKTQKQRPGDNG